MANPVKCWGCGIVQSRAKFKSCSRCREEKDIVPNVAKFCSVACLERNWKRHKFWHKECAAKKMHQQTQLWWKTVTIVVLLLAIIMASFGASLTTYDTIDTGLAAWFRVEDAVDAFTADLSSDKLWQDDGTLTQVILVEGKVHSGKLGYMPNSLISARYLDVMPSILTVAIGWSNDNDFLRRIMFAQTQKDAPNQVELRKQKVQYRQSDSKRRQAACGAVLNTLLLPILMLHAHESEEQGAGFVVLQTEATMPELLDALSTRDARKQHVPFVLYFLTYKQARYWYESVLAGSRGRSWSQGFVEMEIARMKRIFGGKKGVMLSIRTKDLLPVSVGQPYPPGFAMEEVADAWLKGLVRMNGMQAIRFTSFRGMRWETFDFYSAANLDKSQQQPYSAHATKGSATIMAGEAQRGQHVIVSHAGGTSKSAGSLIPVDSDHLDPLLDAFRRWSGEQEPVF